MKKLLSIFTLFLLFNTPIYADKLLKSGFLSGEWKLDTNFDVKDAKNKILIIFNHGQDDHDKPSKNCDLDFTPLHSKEMEINMTLSNSFGFGGTNTALLFKSI